MVGAVGVEVEVEVDDGDEVEDGDEVWGGGEVGEDADRSDCRAHPASGTAAAPTSERSFRLEGDMTAASVRVSICLLKLRTADDPNHEPGSERAIRGRS
ncbi:MAG: hypothetical protein ABEJ61_05580 [Haloferacaceae archaeon]